MAGDRVGGGWRHLPLAKCMRAWHDVVHEARLLRQLPSAADPLDPGLGVVLPPVATADPAGSDSAGLATDLAALTLHAGDLSSSVGPTELARQALRAAGGAGPAPQPTQQVAAPPVAEHARGGLILEDRPAAAERASEPPRPSRAETRSRSGSLRTAGYVAIAAG